MSSLKVVIVDDEFLIRNYLKRRVCWEELGMEIAGEASSAREALDLIDQIIPDIIFTDICMPFMDGIEFSKAVVEKFPHIKIVIITGHDEFDYVKRSIKLGISDFLLKPVNPEEIRKVALELKSKIEMERTHIKEYEKLKQRLDESLPYMQEKFLNEILLGELDQHEIVDKMAYFKIIMNEQSDVFQTAVVEVSDSVGGPHDREEELILLAMKCSDLIRQVLKEDLFVHVFFDNSRKIVILSNNESLDLTDCCETIKALLINRCKCFVSIGIGNKIHGLKNIKVTYREACDALNYKVVIGKNQVVNYNDITYNSDQSWRGIPNKGEKLDFFIKTGMKYKAIELIDELFSESCFNLSITIENLRLEAFDIISTCMRVLLEFKIDTSSLWGKNTKPYEDVFRMDNLLEMKDYLKSLLEKVINKIHSFNERKANILIVQIQEYIEQNMHDSNLSLSTIAKEFYVSPSHLCRLFKQETKQTVVEYITRQRMEYAKKILKETNLKVYQIGEMVGINDPNYFSTIFKKFTGLSVNEFRKKVE
ncbi:response regulator [Pseudobacteroides cellulosolvens]|uniref:Stage 0 sporulation protein A homolog n=1 Tax=Pseudobacteroides cellulosolvens ATCC 35603 = DSM 2933 TaxID=398512 RepID=A0A0L6JPU9_9FIRM|nr:response regulator [Pseudobacteroides cellulosolvens]KNY27808.1 two component transcriptional regulator, AraC family [Pseudobacteroides cellulosolvens ATCC 35603 = DSM 2933]